jgi:hypothetical protein
VEAAWAYPFRTKTEIRQLHICANSRFCQPETGKDFCIFLPDADLAGSPNPVLQPYHPPWSNLPPEWLPVSAVLKIRAGKFSFAEKMVKLTAYPRLILYSS